MPHWHFSAESLIVVILNPCPAEYIKMPRLIFSQSDDLIRTVAINSHLMANSANPDHWLLQKPTDLDLHYLQRQGLSWFSKTRVNFKHR